MKFLIDMNLSPEWVHVFEREGWQSAHWSDIGDPGALDRTILAWAQVNEYCIVTHDLDFGAILAATGNQSPSVVQIRTQNVTPGHLGSLLIEVLRQHELAIDSGALVVVDESKSRVRVLPLRSQR